MLDTLNKLIKYKIPVPGNRDTKDPKPQNFTSLPNYSKLNNWILKARFRNGFNSKEAKMADKLEELLRRSVYDENSSTIRVLNQTLESNYPSFAAREKDLDIIFRLLFVDKYDDVFKMCEDLGFNECVFSTDLSTFDSAMNLDEEQKLLLYDLGLRNKYDFILEDELFEFERHTKPVKVLSKSAFCEYLKIAFAQLEDSKRDKGNITIIDLSKMGPANRVKYVKDGKEVVYGDPYMAEVIAMCQLVANIILPKHGYKAIIGRLGGDEYGVHLTKIDGNPLIQNDTAFVSNLFYEIASKVQFLMKNKHEIIGVSQASFKDKKPPLFSPIDDNIKELLTELSSIPDNFFYDLSMALSTT